MLSVTETEIRYHQLN